MRAAAGVALLLVLLAGCAVPKPNGAEADPRIACHGLNGDEPHERTLVLRVNDTYGLAHGRGEHGWVDLNGTRPSVVDFDLDARGAPEGTQVRIAWSLADGVDATIDGPAVVAIAGTQTCTLAVVVTPGPGAAGQPTPLRANATTEPPLDTLYLPLGAKFDA